MKPAILFFGNCHLGVARNALGRIGTLTDHYDLLFFRHDISPAQWTDEVVPAIHRAAFLFEQITADTAALREAVHRQLPSSCRRIAMAPSFLHSLWPFVVQDPRNERRGGRVAEPYPKYLCNRFILQFLERGDPPEIACRRFLEMDIERAVDLDRLHQLGLAQLRGLEQGRDIALADFIESRFRTERLFLMPLHPAGALFAELCRRMLEVLGLTGLPDAVALLDDLRRFHGVGGYDAPIHPQVARHFGLTWTDDLLYRHFDEGDFDHDSFCRRYARFDFDDGYYDARWLARIGRRAEALALLRRSVDANPGSRYVARAYTALALEAGDLGELLAVLDRALDAAGLGDDAPLWVGAARAALLVGELPLCEAAARRATGLAPDEAEAWALLSLALGQLGRREEADAAARRGQWLRGQPMRRPLVEPSGAEFGRHWLGWDDPGL